MKWGIIVALPEEYHELEKRVLLVKKSLIAEREFLEGTLLGQEVVVVLSRVGKVAAATTATILFSHFNIGKIILSGVAGSVDQNVNIGDIVISTKLIQHDMDASLTSRFKKYEVPLTGKIYFESSSQLVLHAISALNKVFSGVKRKCKVHTGVIASGDQFIGASESVRLIKEGIPEALCVEMEGAAVAQVCHEFNKDFVVVRIISDKADEDAQADFGEYILNEAALVTANVAEALVGHF